MSALREQILARIEATPFRPPSIADIMRGTRLSFITISGELADLINDRIIDTQTGDSGLTYVKAKPLYVPAEKPRTVSICNHAGIEYFPAKNKQPRLPKRGNEALKNAQRSAEVPKAEGKKQMAESNRIHQVAENDRKRLEKLKREAIKKATSREERMACRNKVTQLLTTPMSAAQFAALAGIDKLTASARLGLMQSRGFLQADNLAEPKLFFFASMEPFDVKHYRDVAKAFRIKSTGYDFEQMIIEYQRGDLIKVMCAKWTCNNQKISEIMRLNGIPVRQRYHKRLEKGFPQ